MSYEEKIKVSKEEIVKKLELMDKMSFKKLTTEEYLRRLFTVNLNLKIQEDKNDELRIGNPILRTLNERTGSYYFKIVNKANLEKVNDYVKGKRVLGNGAAIWGKKPNAKRTSAYYSITIDLDWVSERKLKNLLEYIKENNLLVNFITVSGTGLHITFLIEEVNEKQADLLHEIKEKITDFLWDTQDNNGEPLFVEPYIFGTNEENKKQFQGINQGFSMPGSNFKSAFNMPEEYKVSTYLINEKRISLDDLQKNIKQADKQCIYGEIVTENNDERVVQYVKTEDSEKHTDRKHHHDMAKHLISNLIKYGTDLGDGKIIPIRKRRRTTEAIAGMFKSVGVSEKRASEIIEAFANEYYVNNDITRLYTNQELKQTVKDVYSNKIETKWLNLNQIKQRTGISIVRKRDMRKFENHNDYLSAISEQYKNGYYIPGVVKTYKKLAITHPKILTNDKYSLREKLNILESNNINISKSTLRKYLGIINDDQEFSKYRKLAENNDKLIGVLDEKQVKEVNYAKNAEKFVIYKYTKWNGSYLKSIEAKKLLDHFKFKEIKNINKEVFVDKKFMSKLIELLLLIKEEQRVPYHLEEVLNVEYKLERMLKRLAKKGKIEEYEITSQLLNDYKNCIYDLSMDLKEKIKIWNNYYKVYKDAVRKERVNVDKELIKEFNSLMSKVNKKARGFKKLESKPLFNYASITKKIKELNKELRTFDYWDISMINLDRKCVDNFLTYYNKKARDISFYIEELSTKKEKVVFLSSLLTSVQKLYYINNKYRMRSKNGHKKDSYIFKKVMFFEDIIIFLTNSLKYFVSYEDNSEEYDTIKECINALLGKKRISIEERTNLLSNLITA